jgi:hypothetical protein
LVTLQFDGSQLNIINSTASKSGHYDGEKSPFFPSAMGLWFFMISDLDGISSFIESLDPTFFPSGVAQIFGEVEAAYGYDAWGPLKQSIIIGECLVHSNHGFVSGHITNWGHNAVDIEGVCARLRLGGGAVLRQP